MTKGNEFRKYARVLQARAEIMQQKAKEIADDDDADILIDCMKDAIEQTTLAESILTARKYRRPVSLRVI